MDTFVSVIYYTRSFCNTLTPSFGSVQQLTSTETSTELVLSSPHALVVIKEQLSFDLTQNESTSLRHSRSISHNIQFLVRVFSLSSFAWFICAGEKTDLRI